MADTTNMLNRSSAAALLHRLQRKLSDPLVELVYTPHERWPFPRNACPDSTSNSSRPSPLCISVLDSSFNPPTLAHLALANSPRPRYSHDADSDGLEHDYHAKILLLSVRNADKSLKPHDATYSQRLEMMALLARDVISHRNSDEEGGANVAVAIIDEPTFVGKSKILRAFLQQRLATILSSLDHQDESVASPQPQLTFLLGFDTLERLFSPRYYVTTPPPKSPTYSESSSTIAALNPYITPPSEVDTENESMRHMLASLRDFLSPSGDDSRVVCARRVSVPSFAQRNLGVGDADQTPKEQQDEFDSLEKEAEETQLQIQAGVDKTLALAREFIDSERVVLIDIGEDERKFSSSEVREKIGSGDEDWRRLVPKDIAGYVVNEGLYV